MGDCQGCQVEPGGLDSLFLPDGHRQNTAVVERILKQGRIGAAYFLNTQPSFLIHVEKIIFVGNFVIFCGYFLIFAFYRQFIYIEGWRSMSYTEKENDEFIDFNESTFLRFSNLAIFRTVNKAKKAVYKTNNHETAFSDLSEPEFDSMEQRYAYILPAISEFKKVHAPKIDMIIYDTDLADAIQGLPLKLRDVILLSYFTEMNDDGIANVLKVTRRTVINRRKEALKKLKLIFIEKGGHRK